VPAHEALVRLHAGHLQLLREDALAAGVAHLAAEKRAEVEHLVVDNAPEVPIRRVLGHVLHRDGRPGAPLAVPLDDELLQLLVERCLFGPPRLLDQVVLRGAGRVLEDGVRRPHRGLAGPPRVCLLLVEHARIFFA